MADELTKEEIENNPQHYRILKGGAVFDNETHRICGHMASFEPDKYQFPITKSNAKLMWEKRHQKYLRSHMKGLANAAGIEIADDASDDELVSKATDAVQLLTAHMARQFMKSTNIRGMSEAFAKLTQPFMERGVDDDSSAAFPVLRGLVGEIARVARAIDKTGQQRLDSGDVIDVSAEDE